MTEVRSHAASRAAGEAAQRYRTALATGRATLDADELARLLAAADLHTTTAPADAIELSIRVHATREFGLVLSAGAGGLDGALDPANFARDRAAVHAAVELTDGEDFLERFRRTIAWQRITALAARRGVQPPDAALARLFEAALQLAAGGLPDAPGAQAALQELALDCACDGEAVRVVAARCSVGAPPPLRVARPIHKIDRLLHPERIGIVGASASGMNFGRIILRNLLGSGCAPERLCVIRPGGGEIDGVACIENLAAIEGKLDLLIVAVAADAVYPLVDEIIAAGTVEAVMLIPGGLGETAKSRAPAADLAARINAAHACGDGGPIFLGANCLGVVSHPGRYDSWFIPLERLPKPQKAPERRAVMLSQSGAFMITRLSHNPWLDPRYMIAMGNQTDLTHGDLLSWFAAREDVDSIGIYVEGFRDLDGLAFARAVRRAVLAGKQVVVYKSGRSEAGQAGVMGHTASIAGDPVLFASVLAQAGATVTDDVEVFDDLFYMAGTLHAKRIGGDRLAAASGAGFEAVSAADAIVGETFSMRMAALSADTVGRIEAVLAEKKLAALVEVRNPLDMNPGADDDAHVRITAAMIEDPEVDAVVVGLDPTAPMVRALEQSRLRPGYDLSDPESTVHTLPPLVARTDKPIVAVVDAGRLYDAMAAGLMDRGVCVFRNVARGTRALVRHVEARLDAERIRRHFGQS
ncbi:CoA-binding protein [Thauera sp.]|mgnify:FL=1|uniref:CoA-binding protein n=1 Tax=Thauera sp. TaxID=1905334 RepID=UPI001B3DBFCA|nr:CoA-binding protein [Thauera sp.]MBP6130378.1 CoA-binding protein [Thauera sp.]MBP7048894.1 CoA-binding protein [Thauera sp.]HNV89337.1 CoA-binding protein [Thauera aminoaromatica]HPV59868.1 CoA-binding protein [Thauera aminoaromatica]